VVHLELQIYEKLWDDVETRPAISVRLSNEYLHQWQQERSKHQRMTNDSGSGIKTRTTQNCNNNMTRWRKPAFSEVKCNMDATIFKRLKVLRYINVSISLQK